MFKVKIEVEHNHSSVTIGGEAYTVITPGASPMGTAEVHQVGFGRDVEQIEALDILRQYGLRPCTLPQLVCLPKNSLFDIYCLGSTLFPEGRPGRSFIGYLDRKTGLSLRRSDFRTLFRWSRVAAVEG